jgi:hypothetical protein
MLFALAVAFVVAFAEGTIFVLAQMRRDRDDLKKAGQTADGRSKNEPDPVLAEEIITGGDAKDSPFTTLRQRTRRHPVAQ